MTRPEDVRAEVRAWLAVEWDPHDTLVGWRRRLLASGWACPSWPSALHGRDLPAWADDLVAEEIAAHGAVGTPPGVGTALVAPTVMAHGSEELRAQLLPRLLTGEDTWCQLFSEPGSGSDLAGLSCTAVRDGDEWVISGQKLWSTSAHHADMGLLLARTDWDVPKHQGITAFALPMRQAGVEVRPLRQMNGHASFNEIFLDEAKAPAANVIGDVGNGWRVALTTLAHERRFGTLRAPATSAEAAAGTEGRVRQEAAAEAGEFLRTYEWYPQRAGRVDLVVPLARSVGRSADPLVRQEIARLLTLQRTQQWTARRAQAARALGRPPGAEGSIGKLGASHVARAAARVHALVAGAEALLTGPASLADGAVAEVLVSVPAQSIAGGTDEIQRNILGEQVLGLPREPAPDRDLPYRQVPRG